MTQASVPDAPEKPMRRMLQNFGWLLSSKALSAVLSVVYLAMITQSLGAVDFGKFALIFSFAQAIAGLVAFQTWQIILRYGTSYVFDKRHDEFARLIWVCLGFDLIGFILGSILCATGLWLLSGQFGWNAVQAYEILAFTLLLLLSARSTAIGILRVHDRFRDAAIGDSLLPIIRFFGVFLVIWYQPSIRAFLIVWLLSELIATAAVWIIIGRSVPVKLRSQKLQDVVQHFRSHGDLGRFAGFSNLVSSIRLFSQQIIVIIVGYFAGPAAAGFFRLAHQLGQVIARLADGLSTTIYAEFSRVTHHSGAQAAQSMIGRTLKVTGISALIILALLFITGKQIIIALFGAQFAPAFPLVLLLGCAAAIQVGATALEPALLARGHAGWALTANAIGAALMLLSLLWLLPNYGAVGASVAVLLGSGITAMLLFRFYKKLQSSRA
jgi:O-antigen/teichoic acid export membrane protein